jgi:Fe-S cluster assembly protein SufD
MSAVHGAEADESVALLRPQPGRRVEPTEEVPTLAAQRAAAERALLASGLPGRKDEAWRFTSVRAVLELAPEAPADLFTLDRVGARARELVAGGAVLPIVDGVALVTAVDALPNGVQLMALDDAHRAGVAVTPVQLVPERHFRALNTARFERGALLRVEGQQEAPIHVVYLGTGSAVAHAKLHVEVVAGARVTLVEHFVGQPASAGAEPRAEVLLNAVTDVRVGQNAELEHVRVHHSRQHLLGEVAVEVGRDARYHSRVVTLGGPLMRLGLHVALVGEGGSATLEGVYHVSGRDHVDHHTLVEHRASRCTSREDYRGVIDQHGTAVFDGIAWVHRAALVSEAHQQNRNLLLTETATVHTKPHLEIDTDSVVASHGATVGSLDEDQVFYLRSRGLRESQARALLTFAFVRELLERITDEATRVRAQEEMAARLPDGAGLLALFQEAP